MNKLKLTNIILTILIVILIINIIFPLDSISGEIVYRLDPSKPKCTFYNTEEYVEIKDLSRCCYHLQQQLICEQKNQDVECYISETGTKYLINSKTLNYCKKEGYDVEKS